MLGARVIILAHWGRAGFTSAHTEFKDYDKYGFCAGKHGMFVKKGKRSFAFGGGCKGKGLFALQKDEDNE